MLHKHQVIARKWRPKSFSELIGQGTVCQTLMNSFSMNRVPQVLLFTGPRGTGKTSTARILAKILRCENKKNHISCDKCSECLAILEGQNLHVIEIDGASNNGVDSIRELKNSVDYSPCSGFYKIYIIDEVHMLSTSAFNALLKTLEEPPRHVVFILATTEAHKIPNTILSRCQKFRFKRIPSTLLVKRLESICQKEKVKIDEEALWLIAYEGEGCVRDSETLLEQAITFSDHHITSETLYDLLGLTSRKNILQLVKAFLKGDTKSVLSVMEIFKTSSEDPHRLLKNILQILRNLLIVKFWGVQSRLMEVSQVEQAHLQRLSQDADVSSLYKLFDLFLEGERILRFTSTPFLALEVLLLKATMLGKKKVENFSQPSSQKNSSQKNSSQNVNPSEESSSCEWRDLIEKVRKSDPMIAAQLKHLVVLENKNKSLILEVPQTMKFMYDGMNRDVKPKLTNYLNTFWEAGYQVTFKIRNDGGPTSFFMSLKDEEEREENQKREDIKKEVENHEIIEMTKKVFKNKIQSIILSKE